MIELKIKCNNCGNTWWKRPTHIKKNKHGCRICGYESMAESNRKYDIQFFKDLAIKRGLERTGFAGKCLTKKFLSVDKKLLWECGACGNKWKTRPHYILYNFSWCPNCQNNYTEEICRQFFENLFFSKFPRAEKGKFLWLVNDNGNFMELDGHNKLLSIAFESQGIQHYIPVKYFYKGDIKKFKKRIKDDKRKRELTNQNGYKLIEIGYEWRNEKLYKISFTKMEDYIRTECKKKEIIVPNKNKINWREFQIYNPNKVKEMQEIAISRNGRLLSKAYFNSQTNLHWYHNECRTDWWATPSSIKGSKNTKGSWCPKCAGRGFTIVDMQELAEKELNGGRCLSTEYKDNLDPLYWECGLCEHKFWKSAQKLRKKNSLKKCPNCLSIKNIPQLHIDILECLKLEGEKTITDISDYIKIPNSKIMHIVRESLFERYNLIKREINLKNALGRNPYLYSITKKGLDVLKIKFKIQILDTSS